MKIRPIDRRVRSYIKKHQLDKKFKKQVQILEQNHRHPSLHTELLEPRSEGVYSFRVDRKYRGLFLVIDSEIEIIDINDHYQ